MNPFFESSRTSIHRIETMNAPSNCEPHYHQSVEILYSDNCEVETLVNGEFRTLRSGEICVADCYDVHSFNSRERNVTITIIPPEYLNDYLETRGKMHLSTPFIEDETLCGKIAETMKSIEENESDALIQKGLVNVVMGLIVKACGLSVYADADLDLMQSVLHYIEDNCAEEINLTSVSVRFGYSKYYFSRMFNRLFKCSLNDHLAQVRIKRFLSCMQANGKADIVNTALDCGFGSFQTFYRYFKRYYGMSPKKYLNSL